MRFVFPGQQITQKLAFVKAIKDATGLGLREAKEFADGIYPAGHEKSIEIPDEACAAFRKKLTEINTMFTDVSRVMKLARVVSSLSGEATLEMVKDFIERKYAVTAFDEATQKRVIISEIYAGKGINNDTSETFYGFPYGGVFPRRYEMPTLTSFEINMVPYSEFISK